MRTPTACLLRRHDRRRVHWHVDGGREQAHAVASGVNSRAGAPDGNRMCYERLAINNKSMQSGHPSRNHPRHYTAHRLITSIRALVVSLMAGCACAHVGGAISSRCVIDR